MVISGTGSLVMEKSEVRWDRVRFGLFEADLRAGELRRSGIRIRLQGLPFKLLSILLERPGELVTREELQQRIWGTSTVVDFEHSLGSAINKLREALCDSAENPRYIETLARRGYRFITPVQTITTAAAQSLAPSDRLVPATADDPAYLKTPETVLGKSNGNLQTPESRITGLARNRRLRWMVGALAAFLIVIASATAPQMVHESLPPQLIRTTQLTWSDSVYPGEIGRESFPSLATDGMRIYFSGVHDGRLVLVHSSPLVGESYPVAMPAEIVRPSLADIFADGSKFLIQSHQWSQVEEPLWVVPSTGGAARIVRGGPAHDAVWTPDGRSILYASGHDLFTTQDDGKEPKKLASVPGRAFWIHYSPDGSLIRFTVIDPATRTTSLWEISAHGKNLRPLLEGWNNPSAECCGSWTVDGKHYIFQSTRNGQSNIWALKESWLPSWALSRKLTQVTAGPLNYLAPAPARQPNSILVIGARSRNHLLHYDTRSRQLVPYLPALNEARRTEISRDGSRVAWVSSIDGSLWQSKLDGSQRLQLTSPPIEVFMMRWSPDGTAITLMGKEPGKPWKIYLVPAEGGNLQMLLKESHGEADPGWSPDGKSIVFGRSAEYMGEDSSKAIYLLDLKTRSISEVAGSAGLFSPRLSPDGRQLVALSLDQRKLMLFDFFTHKWTELVNGSADNPTWSSDGKSIYFHAFMEEGQPIHRILLSDHSLERIVDFSDLGPAEAVDYLGLTPGNEPLISVHLWTANVYSLDWDPR